MSDLTETVSFDQFTDFRTVDELTNRQSKIIFSKKAYEHFRKLIRDSENSGNETGVFFLGKEQGKDSNVIYIDAFTTDFAQSYGFFEGGATEDTRESQHIREKAVREYGYDCLFHFHVHIAPKGSHYDAFSDQDLKIYTDFATSPWFQYYSKEDVERVLGIQISNAEYEKVLQSFLEGQGTINDGFEKKIPSNKKVNYFGMLATPDRTNNTTQDRTKHNNYQISTIFPEVHYDGNGRPQVQFYRFPNMYYVGKDNRIFKIGSFERRMLPVLTGGRRISDRKVHIQGIGNDPNTGRAIQDIEVGRFIDGQFVFGRQTTQTVTPQDLSTLTRIAEEREPTSISRGIKKVTSIVRGFFDKEKDRNE